MVGIMGRHMTALSPRCGVTARAAAGQDKTSQYCYHTINHCQMLTFSVLVTLCPWNYPRSIHRGYHCCALTHDINGRMLHFSDSISLCPENHRIMCPQFPGGLCQDSRKTKLNYNYPNSLLFKQGKGTIY